MKGGERERDGEGKGDPRSDHESVLYTLMRPNTSRRRSRKKRKWRRRRWWKRWRRRRWLRRREGGEVKGRGGAREGEGEGLVALVTLSTLSLYITSTPS